MEVSELRYHLKIILDGFIYILRTVLFQLLTILTILFLILCNLRRLPEVKIKWDINLSVERFLQFLSVSIKTYILLFIYLTIGLGVTFSLYYLNNYGRIAVISYWIYVYHHHATTFSIPDKIGNMAVRSNFLGRYARTYYPIELIKTAELAPDRNYIIASFPHGIMPFGACTNMLFDIGKWMSLFPHIRPMMATLDINFYMPIVRNVLHGLGVISVSKDALQHYLCQSNDPSHSDNKDGFTSNAIALVVGGAQEAIYSTPGVYKLVLKNRKGFVRIAILSGCSIVPSFSFGEVDLFDQFVLKPGSLFNRFQYFFKNLFGIWPALLIGRGIFQETCGLLPRRKSVVQVVGAPIDVVQSGKPDAKYVDEIHEKFTEALIALFETHKEKYLDNNENVQLLII